MPTKEYVVILSGYIRGIDVGFTERHHGPVRAENPGGAVRSAWSEISPKCTHDAADATVFEPDPHSTESMNKIKVENLKEVLRGDRVEHGD